MISPADYVTSIVGSRLAVEVLMKLQYEFPLTPTPYCDVASSLGIEVDELLEMLNKLRLLHVLKRVGFYFNVRASGKNVALIAISTSNPEAASKHLMELLEVTHSYLRENDKFNLWVVGRHTSRDAIVEAARATAERYGDGRWAVLWSVRTYRLSVKYDLISGTSRAGPYSEIAQSPPSPEELGVPGELAAALRRLPLAQHPYRAIAVKFRLDEERVFDAARRLLAAGVLADPGAALDGHRIGFKYNVMVTVKAREDRYDELCREIMQGVPEATHIVLRRVEPPGAWSHLCYFMVHAVSMQLIDKIIDRLYRLDLVDDVLKLPSIRDLAPGLVR
ncbi:Lrp/AsnC family transcriptional regulator [Hyperthermus butylicus]|uniref:siroheme decarboxylase n=1 Tax=Hyperthermus butylicus (strain DSM 5456 / JCM 9403 / PLM1-5) TaxID=415426 RepID=A2BIS3_HYPBU|nr:Lrp/AsnC family transcriptional regulator [Hyperthermus butylicus]ABM79914.1 hypothetical protein Hbut_0036 [Hyperthermus butylicus DSM 5456]